MNCSKACFCCPAYTQGTLFHPAKTNGKMSTLKAVLSHPSGSAVQLTATMAMDLIQRLGEKDRRVCVWRMEGLCQDLHNHGYHNQSLCRHLSFLQTKTAVGLLSPFILISWGCCLQLAPKWIRMVKYHVHARSVLTSPITSIWVDQLLL